LYGRVIDVEGTVSSESAIAAATITLNGEPRNLPLVYQGGGSYHYSFDAPLELRQGWNEISVTATDTEGYSGSDTIMVFADIPVTAILIELTWNTSNDDLDSHLIMPGGSYGDYFGDCYYLNSLPDWDGFGGAGTAGDPALDVDDIDGWGPEYIALERPPFDGVYQYKVHCYWDQDPNDGSLATVKIWINEVLVFQQSKTLFDEEVWNCASIGWDVASGTGVVY